MLSDFSTLQNASNNKTNNFQNNPIVINIKSFFLKLFDGNKIKGYEYSDNGTSRFINKSVYDGMTFDDKLSLGPVKPINK